MDTEKYWRERCEGLLGVLKVVFYATVKPEENPIVEWEKFLERNNYKELYEQLKSTPIPILTPCVELEKEVERLKGLISVALTTDPPRTIDEINKFKTEYNL